ncbi:hypothetical protein [Methylobacterium sp. NEAU K]|uniref:hypothetical protein n=1 Tax=Methylobacterium sp. NEAU K TaxID=3064946 RepID=UPI0027362065|nr:hypothetical protein [Methylobacterium sp. NEAU K]MDP4006498.1 hypothetical protein [Methylobacterium sp. NEAU K]
MDPEEREFEHSRLSGPFTLDGETFVDVEIYRYAETQDRWRLEVVHLTGGCRKWPQTFATEADAYAAFISILETAGIACFTSAPPKSRH